MSILSKLVQGNLSKEGKEALRLREEYMKRLMRSGMDENDLIFKTTEELKSLAASRPVKATKSFDEREQDRIFEYRLNQLSKN